MRIEPEISGTSIVLRGSFDPLIFTSAWFALHDLLPENSLDQKLAHSDLALASTEWLNLEVTRDKFKIETLYAPYSRICDLVLRVFRDNLNHTPVNALGINRNVHFCVDSKDTRNLIGRTLAPVAPWGKPGIEVGLDLETGGMTSLTMTSNNPDDRPSGGRINITVQPSNRVGNGETGIYIEVNDHFAFGNPHPKSCEISMRMLAKNFDKSLSRSSELINHIMSLTYVQEN